MCGISGVFGAREDETVSLMLARIVHRGPDDVHQVGGSNFSIGARRLSIVGVEDGRQPLSNIEQKIWACQNGELYNYPKTKRKLEALGYFFRTHCDTELLPHLYREYATDLPLHIDGMFAIAVWDVDKQEGLIARDRMGKKPLYYYQSGDKLYFASEIKCLLAIPGINREIDLAALSHFLSLKHVPSPMTIFAGIKVLPPAHTLVYKVGRPVQIKRYWRLDFSPSAEFSGASETDLVDKLIDLLKKGVNRRLMSDVPIGFFLSGGIDSSLSTAIAAEMHSEPIKTFTLTYDKGSTTDGKELDKYWATYTAKRYKTEHFEETVKYSSFPENLRRIISCFDEPFTGTTSTYFLAGLIAKHVKVAISGDGADELFGSYLSHRLAKPLSQFQLYKETGNAELLYPLESQIKLLEKLWASNDATWRAKLMVYDDTEKLSLFSGEVADSIKKYKTSDLYSEYFSNLTAVDPLNRVLEAEFNSIFPDQVLAFIDRLSMAHSLEVRSAYLDTAVVEFAAKVPGSLKIRNGETKYLLKKAALRYLPEEMVFRRKEGFLMPITEWILNDLEQYVRDTLSPTRLALHGLFNEVKVASLLNDLYNGSNHYTQVNKVFALLVFQEWFEMYMGSTANQHSTLANCS